MKKTLLIAIATAGLLYSCGGGPSAEELKAGAEKMCSCMADKSAENAEMSEDMVDKKVSMDYTTCSLGVVGMGIDPTSEDFTKAIDANCAELSAQQAAYVSTMKK
ncbi:MAG: hypothetical protein ACPGVD_08590 [Flavobacteriales bacterium]